MFSIGTMLQMQDMKKPILAQLEKKPVQGIYHDIMLHKS